MVRYLLFLAWLIYLCSYALAGDTPADAVVWAAQDKASLPEIKQPHQVYLWVHNPSPENTAAVIGALNFISKSEVNVLPTPLLGGRLLRVDLLTMAPSIKDYATMRSLWDSLVVNEPYFYHLGEGSKTIEPITICGQEFKSLAVRTFNPALQQLVPEAANSLAQGSSLAVILRADQFVKTVLTPIDGGRYYDFIGVTSKTDKKTYLARHGISEEQVTSLRSDERAALVRSQVTGKPRRIDVFRGSGVRPSVGTGLVAITHDTFDEDGLNAAKDPIRNLLEAEDQGTEIILERVNGWHEYTLWNKAGASVLSGPDNLVADHLIPAPHTKRLVAAMSCIRCHGPNEGWQPFVNDVKRMLQGQSFDILGDLTQVDQTDTLRRLAGLYSGDLSLPLRIGRDSYSDVVFRATKMPVPAVHAAIASLHDSYTYDLVDAAKACNELGINIILDSAELTLKAALPPKEPVNGIALEDPIVRLLQAGIPINRKQFELVYTDLALRSAPFVLNQREKAKAGEEDQEQE